MINHALEEDRKKKIPFTFRALKIHAERDQRGQTKR